MRRWRSLTGIAGAVLATMTVLGPSAAAGERAVPQCTNAHLTASYRAGDAGAGHRYGWIVLRNTSERSCWVRGYGGLSYVGQGDGTQVGAAADRTPSRKPRTLVEPGQRVRSAVDETSYAPYPKRKCRPTEVDGFRVYLPDETRSQFVAHPTIGCANPKVHLLSHQAYR